ncbi:MAG TPA: PDZ domain-containing protein [Lacunisphaera sp.]|nr:PDZ domain-containing protein [Lacunisphaera sp.]
MKDLLVALAFACACAATLSGEAQNPPTPTSDRILVLDPIKVHGSPVISFAIDIRIYADPETRKVDRIFITRVLPDTDADRAGLQAGDEIVKLDDVAVKEFEAVVSVETPLGRVLLNRTVGEPLRLEAVTRRTAKFTLRAQRETPGSRLLR